MNRLQRYASLIGRVLLCAIFLISALGKIADWNGTAGYMSARVFPAVSLFLALAILFELAGGLSVLLGFKTQVGAVLLLVFIVIATLKFHNFWTYPEAEQQNQMIHFLKNVAIMGGLLLLMAHGPGPISVDRRKRRS